MKNSKKKLKLNLPKKFIIYRKILAFILFFSITISPSTATIVDSFVETTLDKNLKIQKHESKLIIDNFAEANTNKNPPIQKSEIPKEILPTVIKPYKKRKYIITEDFRPTLPIRIVKPFTTKANPQEGSYLEFVTVKDIKYNGKVYPAGTVVKGRIETVSQNAMNGDPANVVIGSFDLQGIPLYGEISKTGADRMLWLKPLSFAVGIFGVPGILLMFVRGGHAKIKPKEIYTISF